jgi:hypothetical protein
MKKRLKVETKKHALGKLDQIPQVLLVHALHYVEFKSLVRFARLSTKAVEALPTLTRLYIDHAKCDTPVAERVLLKMKPDLRDWVLHSPYTTPSMQVLTTPSPSLTNFQLVTGSHEWDRDKRQALWAGLVSASKLERVNITWQDRALGNPWELPPLRELRWHVPPSATDTLIPPDLRRLRRLEVLELKMSPTSKGLRLLGTHCPNLRHLALRGTDDNLNAFTVADVRDLFKTCKELDELNLRTAHVQAVWVVSSREQYVTVSQPDAPTEVRELAYACLWEVLPDVQWQSAHVHWAPDGLEWLQQLEARAPTTWRPTDLDMSSGRAEYDHPFFHHAHRWKPLLPHLRRFTVGRTITLDHTSSTLECRSLIPWRMAQEWGKSASLDRIQTVILHVERQQLRPELSNVLRNVVDHFPHCSSLQVLRYTFPFPPWWFSRPEQHDASNVENENMFALLHQSRDVLHTFVWDVTLVAWGEQVLQHIGPALRKLEMAVKANLTPVILRLFRGLTHLALHFTASEGVSQEVTLESIRDLCRHNPDLETLALVPTHDERRYGGVVPALGLPLLPPMGKLEQLALPVQLQPWDHRMPFSAVMATKEACPRLHMLRLHCKVTWEIPSNVSDAQWAIMEEFMAPFRVYVDENIWNDSRDWWLREDLKAPRAHTAPRVVSSSVVDPELRFVSAAEIDEERKRHEDVQQAVEDLRLDQAVLKWGDASSGVVFARIHPNAQRVDWLPREGGILRSVQI